MRKEIEEDDISLPKVSLKKIASIESDRRVREPTPHTSKEIDAKRKLVANTDDARFLPYCRMEKAPVTRTEIDDAILWTQRCQCQHRLNDRHGCGDKRYAPAELCRYRDNQYKYCRDKKK